MDELKSTNLSMFFDTVDLPEVPSSEIPVISKIPPATAIGNAILADDGDESETAETDDEELGTRMRLFMMS